MKKRIVISTILIMSLMCSMLTACGSGSSKKTILDSVPYFDSSSESPTEYFERTGLSKLCYQRTQNIKDYFTEKDISFETEEPSTINIANKTTYEFETVENTEGYMESIWNIEPDDFLGYRAYIISDYNDYYICLTFDSSSELNEAQEKVEKYFTSLESKEFKNTTFYKYLENPSNYSEDDGATKTSEIYESIFGTSQGSFYYINYQKENDTHHTKNFEKTATYDDITMVNIQTKNNMNELKEYNDYIYGDCDSYILIKIREVDFVESEPTEWGMVD